MDAIERRLRASREAAHWWALLQAGDVPRAEREKFVQWLSESRIHVIEILHIMQVDGTLGQFEEWGSIEVGSRRAEVNVVPISQALAAGRRSPGTGRTVGRSAWLKRAIGIAAGVAALIVGGVALLPIWQEQLIATERGERREVVLEDGSVVQVDPQTRLRVHFEADVRRLKLLEGRALFRVAKNPHRPFVVESDGAMVRAVGTAFGVERRADHVLVVTVAEGKVAVVTQRPPPQSTTPDSVAADAAGASSPGETFVVANQQATVQRARATVPVHTVDSHQELAWAEGRLIFKDDPVAKVVAQFNRYNRVQIRVTDAALSARRVSGVFDAAYPEEFIAFVEGALPVTIERADPGTITIAPLRPSQDAE